MPCAGMALQVLPVESGSRLLPLLLLLLLP
jgi:hypothetical protein